MEFLYEKVYALCENKNFLIDIYSVGKKVHDQIDCKRGCECLKFLEELDNLIEKMKCQETHPAERSKFIKPFTKNLNLFLVFDQINKKFGTEIFNLEDNCFKTAVFSRWKK